MAAIGFPRVGGRGTQKRENASRQRIAVVVEELLATRRLDELQVNDIVAAAGISRPTFYAHYDSKYSVVASLIHDIGSNVVALWAPLFESNGPVERELILECAYATIDSWRARPALCVAATEGWHTSTEIHEAWNPVIQQFNRAVAKRIERAGIPLEHPEQTAAALVAMFERCMYLTVAVSDSPLFNEDEALAQVMSSIWAQVLSGKSSDSAD